MIKEWFSEYVSQPIKNFYSYIKGKVFGEVDTSANLGEGADFGVYDSVNDDPNPSNSDHNTL